MNLRPRFSLKRLLRHGRAEVRRSLQARTVALTVILTPVSYTHLTLPTN